MKFASKLLFLIIMLFAQNIFARVFILYPPGDPNYTISIQSLISLVSFGGDASDIDTLILKDGTYNENITIDPDDFNILITSENGYENVNIVALNTSAHVFTVNARNVTIQNLTIYGATGNARAGIYMPNGYSATFRNNRIGYDPTHKNYRGIHIHDNVYDVTISDNLISYNTDGGIYMQNTYNNYISRNIVNNNSNSSSSYKSGIYCLNTATSTISNNTANSNNRYGLYLVGSGSISNTISGNTFNSNGYSGFWGSNCGINNYICENNMSSNTNYDIAFSSSSGSYIFLNNLTKGVGQFIGSSNVMYSPITIYYKYNGSYYKNYLGNYYGGTYTDADNDGIVDGSGAYNIVSTCDDFTLEKWGLFNNGEMDHNTFSNAPKIETIAATSSIIWKSDFPAESDAIFSGTDTWTGQITFTDPPVSGHTLTIEIGSTTDGNAIVLGGPDATITGDGTTQVFQFATDNSEFTVSTGDYLAIRITNNSAAPYNILTGGAYSFTSSPAQSGILPVELINFSYKIDGNKIILNWDTATEINNYGFEIERSINDMANWESIGFIDGHGNSNSPKQYQFVDNYMQSTNQKYRLKQLDIDGGFEYSEIIEIAGMLPGKFKLDQNYPNPFNPSTKISYSIPQESRVIIKVYDALGNEIQALVNEEKNPGIYSVNFDGSNLASGIYFYRIEVSNLSTGSGNGFIESKKMILLK